MNDFKNRNIITGASGGIGNVIVKKLYESGANVLASVQGLKNLRSLKINLRKLKYCI